MGAASLRTLAAHLNAQRISTVRGQGGSARRETHVSASEKIRPAREESVKMQHPFCPVTLPDRRKSKGLCASELVQFRIELSAILDATR